jgi:hypothetical protein
MRNLVLVKARLARGGMLAIGQSASEPEPHRVRSTSLAIGADDLDARGRSPMCHQRTRSSLGGEAEVAPSPSSYSGRSRSGLRCLLGAVGANCDRTIRFFWVFPLFAIFLNECSQHTGGDRGEGGVRGDRRGMAGMPRTRAVSIFDGNEIAALLLL